MAECNKCGCKNWVVVTCIGALETWRCENCGDTITVHVNRPLFPDGLPSGLERCLPVAARWISKPTPRKLAELKAILPTLKNIPGISLFQNARDNSTFELGRFTAPELQDYESRLQDLGLEVWFVSVYGDEVSRP